MTYDLSKAIAIYGFAAPPQRQVECAGIAHECYEVLHRLSLGLGGGASVKGSDSLSKCSSTDSSSADLTQENPDEFMDKDEDKYHRYVSKLDPNGFKDQDHYKVLGLSRMRYKATMGQIKTAYRQKVLIYHPDKGKASHQGGRNEAIFACIQKAYEILGMDLDKRRSYDSVDPKFDETLPEASDVNANNFYDQLASVFERNSRFSINQPVPQLGTPKSERDDVEHFYNFWFEFKSWREFSYKDAEDKSRGEDRWERREIEKMNRVEREKLRKEYMKKLLATVEMAYEKDPRIAQFRDADKQRKQDQKDWKKREKQRLADEREAQERKKQAEIDAEKQRVAEEEKKLREERQKMKKEMQLGRKKLRELVQQKKYFTEDTKQHLNVMEGLERVCMNANLEELGEITEKLGNVTELAEALELLSMKKENGSSTELSQQNKSTNPTTKVVVWTEDEIALLIKATSIYPAGSVERWTQVAKYVNDHSKTGVEKPKTDKDVIKEVKRVKGIEASKVLGTKHSYVAPTPTNNVEESTPPPSQQNEETWSPTQQKQLETALKSTDSKDPERWEKIAKAVEGKTKKQCVQRYKHLVQMIKQNKA